MLLLTAQHEKNYPRRIDSTSRKDNIISLFSVWRGIKSSILFWDEEIQQTSLFYSKHLNIFKNKIE